MGRGSSGQQQQPTHRPSARKILPRGLSTDDRTNSSNEVSGTDGRKDSGVASSRRGATPDRVSPSESELPKSVRYAPAELRPAIRRRQNNESAKRSRERRREEMDMLEKQYEHNERRIGDLEEQVTELSHALGDKSKRPHKHGGSNSEGKPSRKGQGSAKEEFYGVPF